MTDAPSLRPGCVLLWQDFMGKFHTSMVVQFVPKASYYEVTLVEKERIVAMYFNHVDYDKTWRVMRGT